LADVNWTTGTPANEVFTDIPGPLDPNMSIIITLTTVVDPNATGGNTENYAEISAADDDTDPDNNPPTDEDSTPDNDPDNDGPTEDNDTDNTNGDED